MCAVWWIVIKVIRVCVRVCGHTRNDNVFCTTNCKKHSIKITVYGNGIICGAK